MLIRALIVLLLVLNLGVAAWWHWSTPATPTAGVELPPHVARLQLVRERNGANQGTATGSGTATTANADATKYAPASTPAIAAQPTPSATTALTPAAAAASATTPTPTPGDAPATAAATPADAARCYSFGPFGSEETLVTAQATLKPLTQALFVRRPPPRAGRGWRVYLPPVANAEEATTAAGRILAAGFRDYFIVREGPEANSVALGRFATETAARRHADTLNAAGFPVRAEPLGGASGPAWVDVRATAGFDAAGLRAQIGAAQLRTADCATLR